MDGVIPLHGEELREGDIRDMIRKWSWWDYRTFLNPELWPPGNVGEMA